MSGVYYTSWIFTNEGVREWSPVIVGHMYTVITFSNLLMTLLSIFLVVRSGCTARVIRRLELASLNLPAIWPPTKQPPQDVVEEAKTTRAMRHATHIDDYWPFLMGIQFARRSRSGKNKGKTVIQAKSSPKIEVKKKLSATVAAATTGVTPLEAFVNDPLFDDKLLTRLIGTFVDDSIAPIHTTNNTK
jgi:hypothetical protein